MGCMAYGSGRLDEGLGDFFRVDRLRVGRGAARAEDAQGTPTQSHISPSILVYEDGRGLFFPFRFFRLGFRDGVGPGQRRTRHTPPLVCGTGAWDMCVLAAL